MANPLKQPLLPEPAFTKVVRREVVDNSLQQARLIMTWRVPGMQDLYETHALDMLASVLGHGRTARLIRDLREDRRLVSNISVSNLNYGVQGMFYISAHLPAEHLETVEAAIAEHIRSLQTDLVTDYEMKRMRTQVANRFIFGNETPSDRASMYGYYQAMVGELAPALNYPAHIQALSADDLQTAAQRYLSPDAYAVTVLKPS
jgi:predicted Zn-dependent peptidase